MAYHIEANVADSIPKTHNIFKHKCRMLHQQLHIKKCKESSFCTGNLNPKMNYVQQPEKIPRFHFFMLGPTQQSCCCYFWHTAVVCQCHFRHEHPLWLRRSHAQYLLLCLFFVHLRWQVGIDVLSPHCNFYKDKVQVPPKL